MKSRIVNWALFVISILLLVLFIQWQVADESILFNEAIAMLFFSVSIPLKIYRVRIGQYVIFAALLILLFSPLSYFYTITEGNTSITHRETKFNSLISPVTFVILILFTMVNYSAMFNLYQLLTKGSETEQEDKANIEVEFYYKKFSECSAVEFKESFKMFNDYPVEAQIALKRIKKEKEL
jgi:hypothetical protein